MISRRSSTFTSLLATALVSVALTPVSEITEAAVSNSEAPTPNAGAAFEFAYETKDEEGNLQMHREQQDVLGRRVGTYGYRHANGIYRFVDYVADSLGYRASIRTNEPGTRTMHGAHVTVDAAAPPPSASSPPSEAHIVRRHDESLSSLPPPTSLHARTMRHHSRTSPRARADESDARKLAADHNRIAAAVLAKSRRPVPLPVIVVASPPRSRLPAQYAEPDEVPRVSDVPVVVAAEEVVHEADVVLHAARRQPSRTLDPALLFPAPPLIRPPRYRPRGSKVAREPGFIEAAFRKRRS